MNKKWTKGLIIAAVTLVAGNSLFASKDVISGFRTKFASWTKSHIETSKAETKEQILASAQASKNDYELSVEEEKAAILSELETLSKREAQSEEEIRKLLADYEAALNSEKAKQLASIDNHFYVLRMQMIAEIEKMAEQFKVGTVDPAKTSIVNDTQEKIAAIKAQIEQTTAQLEDQLAADIAAARKQLLDSMQGSSEEVQQEVLAYFDRLMSQRAAQVPAVKDGCMEQIEQETEAAVESAKDRLAAVGNTVNVQ